MTRQIPWLRVFVEGVVIVGSILLAFGIESSPSSYHAALPGEDGRNQREEEDPND